MHIREKPKLYEAGFESKFLHVLVAAVDMLSPFLYPGFGDA